MTVTDIDGAFTEALRALARAAKHVHMTRLWSVAYGMRAIDLPPQAFSR